MISNEIREIVCVAVQETLSRKEELRTEALNTCYKNVKLLMKNYRKLKKFQANIDEEVLAVESICVFRNKTSLMMQHVDKMLSAYNALCVTDNHPDQQRRWQSLYLRYIAPDKMRVGDIADCLKIDVRTLYRDLDKALADLAVLLFGVEAMGTW